MKKTAKILSLALVLMMALGLLAGCTGTPSTTASPTPTTATDTDDGDETGGTPTDNDGGEETEDGERTTFTVGFDAEFPPYGYMDDDGEYVGFDLTLAAEVAERNNWELVLQPIDWDAKDLEINSGTIDCIWNGFTINGREDLYTWTIPYVDNSQVIVVTAASEITDWAGLDGKNIAVQADSSAEAALNDEEDEEIVALTASFAALDAVPDYNTAFMLLESGACDAVAMDIGVANYQIAQRDDGKFVILDQAIAAEQYGVGFKLGNTELRDIVEATLLEMLEDGTFASIAEEWELTESVSLKAE